MATELLGVLTIIGIVLKILKVFGCLGKCWACICGPIDFNFLKRRREKVKPKLSNDQERERKVLLDEIMDHLSADGSVIHQNMNYRHRSYSSESSPSYLLKTPRYIELDDIEGNAVRLVTTNDPSNIFVFDKNTTLSTTANSTPQSSRTSSSTPQSQRKARTLPGNSSLSGFFYPTWYSTSSVVWLSLSSL